jgi:uncharacterized protein (TIGR02145 family)
MKKIFTVWFLTTILYGISHAQSLAWESTFPGATIHSHYTKQDGTTWVAGKFPNYTIPDSAVANYIALQVDSTGKVVSGIKLLPENITEAYHIGSNENQNVIVFGPNFSIGTNNYFLICYNSNGHFQWKRRIFIHKGSTLIKGGAVMDVKRDRIALMGNYVQQTNVYHPNANTIERTIGKTCDPNRDADCPRYWDIFIYNFKTDGELVWAQKMVSKYHWEMRCWPHTDRDPCNYYYTYRDWNDIVFDITLDNQHNTFISTGHIDYEPDRPSFGDFVAEEYNIQKFNEQGEPQWVMNHEYYQNSKLQTDKEGNLIIFGEWGAPIINLFKFSTDGREIWNVEISGITENMDLNYWLKTDDSLNIYLGYEILDGNTESKIIKFNKDGEPIWEMPLQGSVRNFSLDDDLNTYISYPNNLQKFSPREISSYRFKGSGNWNNVEHWDAAKKPPLQLPKWDTIYIQTAAGDSCILDSLQIIAKGANLIVEQGSHLIVAGNLTSEPPAIPPSPTRLKAFYEPKNPIFYQGNGFLLPLKIYPGQHPVSSGITIEANLTSIGGPVAQLFYDDGTNGDPIAGDFIYSFSGHIPEGISTGIKSISYKAWDNEGRSDSGIINFQILATTKFGSIVISQVYTGGGQDSSIFSHDFIELFNRTKDTIWLEGKSLQYCDENKNFNQYAPLALNGNIPPESYYLIQLSGGVNGSPLPQPDLVGAFNLNETGGKIAFVNSLVPLNCESASTCSGGRRTNIIDLLGYSSSNNPYYYETYMAESLAIKAPQVVKFTAFKRKKGGMVDTNKNRDDFFYSYPEPRNASSPFNNYQPKINISQVYTRAGLIQDSYYHQFIELFNPGTEPVDVTGWSVQYADSMSNTWQMTPLQGTIQPRSFYLIRQAFKPLGSKYLPATTLQGSIHMNTNSGKVALVNHTQLLSDSCPATGIIDFVGYGNADCFEGPSPANQNTDLTNNLSSLQRVDGGCWDTNDNLADWRWAAPSPRNHLNRKPECLSDVDTSVVIDDKDGQIYPVKNFNGVLWMMKNLNYVGGTLPENDTALGRIYGRTFDIRVKNYCPVGYRLPSEIEWHSLANLVGGVGALKDTLLWDLPNTGASNASGFGLLPFGWGVDKGKKGYYWTGDWELEDYYSDYRIPVYVIFSHDMEKIDYSYSPDFPIFLRCVKTSSTVR